jgi:DNA-binding transcriptional MerR regulator
MMLRPASAVVRQPGVSHGPLLAISEAAAELEVEPHVLRFWESKFSQITPVKRGGGRRHYRAEDMALLRRIRSLLYNEGYTIKGVQRLLDSEGDGKPGIAPAALKVVEPPRPSPAAQASAERRQEIELTLSELRSALSVLRKTLLAS